MNRLISFDAQSRVEHRFATSALVLNSAATYEVKLSGGMSKLSITLHILKEL